MRQLNFFLKELCTRNKDGSHSTQANRERILTLVADQLHALGFRQMTAHSLKPKHVNALLEHWQQTGIATATIKNRMAHIRWWAEKVKKSQLIPESNSELGIPRRSYKPTENKAHELPTDKLAAISDARVRSSLELQAAFGLRTEESIKFQPSYADQGDHILLKGSWCKGGQARRVPIRNDYQREVLARAHALAGKGSLIPPSFTYKNQLYKFKAEVYRAGLFNVHGHRHHYAQQRFLEITGFPAPIAGGPSADQLLPEQKLLDHNARLIISEELGHHRESITVNYLGR